MIQLNEQGEININTLTREDFINNQKLIAYICSIKDMAKQKNVFNQVETRAVQLGVGQEFEDFWSVNKHLWNNSREEQSDFLSFSRPYTTVPTRDAMYGNLHKYTAQRQGGYTQREPLPAIKSLDALLANPPALAGELIEGVLRQGHKLLLSGPSKAGKSFALIQLCIAIAEGGKWLNWQCAQGKVLYINLEIDESSAIKRFRDVYAALGVQPKNPDNIKIWNLRGKTVPMDELAPQIIERVKNEHFSAIVLDPIYKVITGDENSADKMGKFCNCLDTICSEVGCSMIYCHHHSKGVQGGKKSMDRASGSGVFARDADAIVDMNPLSPKLLKGKKPNEWAMPLRVTGTLREFPPFAPRNVWFMYPILIVDETGMLDDVCEEGSVEDRLSKGREYGNMVQTDNKLCRMDKVKELMDMYINQYGKVNVEVIANKLHLTVKTIRNYVKDMDDYEIKNGVLMAA